jgi:Protein of unknown function (DUF4232)
MIPVHHTQPAIVQPCRANQIGLRLGRASGAAGTTYYAIVFTNRGSAACALRGYPGLSSVAGAHGAQIGAPARRSPATVVTVVLRPGAAASAAYGQVDALNYPRARCRPVTAPGLRVYAPDETRARYLRVKHLACASSTVEDSVIGPVVRGTSGVAAA